MVTEPPSVIALWFALEDSGPTPDDPSDNGCLRVLPGAHTGPLRARFRRVDGGDSGVETLVDDRVLSPWRDEDFVPLAVPAGSLVVMHGLLPHVSGPNRSTRSRQSYVLHVIDGACHYPADNWLRRGPHLPLRGF